METQRPARDGGAFRWHAGAWFGAQIGSTLWLVILGVALSFRDDSSPGTAIIALAVAVNGIGLILWEHRDRMRPYPAIQTLIAVVGCAGVRGLRAPRRDIDVGSRRHAGERRAASLRRAPRLPRDDGHVRPAGARGATGATPGGSGGPLADGRGRS